MTLALPMPGWMLSGVCADPREQADDWLDPRTDADAQHAVDGCAVCPVAAPCLRWALARGITDGIYGGLTAVERRAHRDFQGPQLPATCSNGHEWSRETTIIDGRGHRRCRTCRRANHRERDRARREQTTRLKPCVNNHPVERSYRDTRGKWACKDCVALRASRRHTNNTTARNLLRAQITAERTA